MKWFLVLLGVLAAGLVAVSVAVPTNAAVVNGTAISQQSLNADVSAIAGSASYQCYLNAQQYLTSGGSSSLPPVVGAGKGQNPGDRPTATMAFVTSYLDTAIEDQLVVQMAEHYGVAATPSQMSAARTSFESQIDQTFAQVLQTPVGQSPRYTCTLSGQPPTGQQVLASLPSSFVDSQVEILATAGALRERLVGSGEGDLMAYFTRHRASFDTVCYTVAGFTSEQAASAASAQVAAGTPFSQVTTTAQGGPQGCTVLSDLVGRLPTSAHLDALAAGVVSQPIEVGGTFYLIEFTSRTPTVYAQAKPFVTQVVQSAGATRVQQLLTVSGRHASVQVNPQYGTWVPATAAVFPPPAPRRPDVLNAPANEVGLTAAPSASPGSG